MLVKKYGFRTLHVQLNNSSSSKKYNRFAHKSIATVVGESGRNVGVEGRAQHNMQVGKLTDRHSIIRL